MRSLKSAGLLAGAARTVAAITLPATLAATAAGQPGATDDPVRRAPEVRILAEPLNPEELRASRPAQVLEGTALERSLEGSLGATLAGQLGVHGTGFGTGASRPVIRGQDAARIRITQSGLDTFDVSALSPDHALASDPLLAQRIEILRGPATLAYGGGAVGGLVNIESQRIPTQRLGAPSGNLLLSHAGAASGHVASAGLRAGQDGLNWSLGGFDRRAGDYRFPGQAIATDPTSATGRLPNSFVNANGLGAGISWVGQGFTLGLAQESLRNHYGIPTEGDVTVRLAQQRTELLALADRPLPGLARVRLSVAQGRYRHDELEGDGSVGTAFRNRGNEGRLELTHLPVAGVRGVFGVHARQRQLSTSGEEAYLPSSRERADALFYIAEREIGGTRLEFGWRHERTRLRPDPGIEQPQRNFQLNAFSAGLSAPLHSGWRIAANLSSSQRAPALEELYASGVHAATATWELGNPQLQRERSLNLDLGLRRVSGNLRGRLGVFANRFENYVHARGTDENLDGIADRVDGHNQLANSVDEPNAGDYTRLVYTQSRARFAGLEAELAWHPSAQPWSLRAFGDLARGRIEGFGNAPRMSPARIGAAIDWSADRWRGYLTITRVSAQQRLAALETSTAGYTRVDGEISWKLDATRGQVVLFLQGRNLLNESIRLHTSHVKDLVPQPGRSVTAGLRGQF